MPRQPNNRLANLDPRAVAADVVERACDLRDRIHQYVHRPALDDPRAGILERPENPLACSLGLEVAQLVHYAQTGELSEGTTSPAGYIQTIGEACYSSVLVDLSVTDDVDSAPDIGLAIVAALARESIDRGLRVDAAGLAALGGVDYAHVRLLCRQGEIREDKEHTVGAREARRWLAARGVPGFR